MKRRNLVRIILGLFISVLLIVPAYAEQPTESPIISPKSATTQPLDEQALVQEQENLMQNLPFAFGGSPSYTVSNIDAWSLQGIYASGVLDYAASGDGFGRSRSSGIGSFLAPIENVPTGASVFGMGIEACDGNASDRIQVHFIECPGPVKYCNLKAEIDTGVGATPGCNYFYVSVNPPVLIWNVVRSYYVEVFDRDESDSTLFRIARLYWHRSISPAPAIATFNDVGPSHWAFQYVEALAASGITQGCPDGPNLFCPDKPVSRAAMATFLARALGLHWPG